MTQAHASLWTLVLTACVMASGLVAGRTAAEDILIVTEGVKTGTLQDCSDEVCRFDGAPVPRTLIYFIGLDAEPPPPAPQDGMRDEVHFRDGSVHPGPLMSIDATNVITASAVQPRKQVAWIWLAPVRQTGSDAAVDTAGAGPLYQWEGTIRVENQYNGNLGNSGSGHHLWRAEYRLKLIEVVYGTSQVRDLVPQQLDYEIQANQAYEIEWDADDYRSLTMLGVARGRLAGEDLAGYYLKGTIVSLDAPLIASDRRPRTFATYSDGFLPYFAEAQARVAESEPGWYYLELELAGAPYARARALYDGIRRGGTLPPVVSDPDQEFLTHVPPWMLRYTYLAGRLEHPEQSEVQGGFTLSHEGHWPDSPDQISVDWSFARRRQ